MSKVLVIHPYDESTVMLNYVYEGKGYDVISDPSISRSELRKAIEEHDKIIMLGHGTPQGLINTNFIKKPFSCPMYMIDYSFADLLRTKETVSIWCYSDEFFRSAKIPGFHTGMIISECKEAYYVLGHCPLTEKQLFDNMVNFSKIIHECIEMPPEEMKKYVLSHYCGNDDITRFNRQNIIVI